MKRFLLAPILGGSLLSVACGGNGTIDGTMVFKCYQDVTLDVDGTSVSARQVFKTFEVPFVTADSAAESTTPAGKTKVVGRVNQDLELQVSAIWECEGGCRFECGAPPSADGEATTAYDPVDIQRVVFSFVAGRHLSGDLEGELFTPASYLSSDLPQTTDEGSGTTRCMTEDEYTDMLERYWAGDDQAYAAAQVNTVTTGPYISDSWIYRTMVYADGATASADASCLYMPRSTVVTDNPDEVVKGGDVTGTVAAYNLDVKLHKMLVEFRGATEGEAATFSISGLDGDDAAIRTVVTENGQPSDFGL